MSLVVSVSVFLLLFAVPFFLSLFFLTPTAPTDIYPLSLHDALPICPGRLIPAVQGRKSPTSLMSPRCTSPMTPTKWRSEEHTSELQSRGHLVCRLLLEKKKRRISRRLTKKA